jgi:hypothetical protein
MARSRRFVTGQLAAGLSGVLLYVDVALREFLSSSRLLEPSLREGSLKWVGLERAAATRHTCARARGSAGQWAWPVVRVCRMPARVEVTVYDTPRVACGAGWCRGTGRSAWTVSGASSGTT